MRVTMDHEDAGRKGCGNCRIWLAGSERRNVVTADEEKRYALLYKLDDNGMCMFDPKDGRVLEEEFFGEVSVVCRCVGDKLVGHRAL